MISLNLRICFWIQHQIDIPEPRQIHEKAGTQLPRELLRKGKWAVRALCWGHEVGCAGLTVECPGMDRPTGGAVSQAWLISRGWGVQTLRWSSPPYPELSSSTPNLPLLLLCSLSQLFSHPHPLFPPLTGLNPPLLPILTIFASVQTIHEPE